MDDGRILNSVRGHLRFDIRKREFKRIHDLIGQDIMSMIDQCHNTEKKMIIMMRS